MTASAPPIHASCVAIRGRGVLIAGRSGSGKSDLALRLIDRGATLVSDDYTLLAAREGTLHAAPPPRIAGCIEVRGVGILPCPHLAEAPVALLVDLDAPVARLPEPASRSFHGIAVPVVALGALEPSAPIKVERALDHLAPDSR